MQYGDFFNHTPIDTIFWFFHVCSLLFLIKIVPVPVIFRLLDLHGIVHLMPDDRLFDWLSHFVLLVLQFASLLYLATFASHLPADNSVMLLIFLSVCVKNEDDGQ